MGRPKDAGKCTASDWKGASWIGTALLKYPSQSRCSHKVKRESGLNSHMDRPGHGTFYSGVVFASAGLYPAEMCTFLFVEKSGYFAGKSSKTAENNFKEKIEWIKTKTKNKPNFKAHQERSIIFIK